MIIRPTNNGVKIISETEFEAEALFSLMRVGVKPVITLARNGRENTLYIEKRNESDTAKD